MTPATLGDQEMPGRAEAGGVHPIPGAANPALSLPSQTLGDVTSRSYVGMATGWSGPGWTVVTWDKGLGCPRMMGHHPWAMDHCPWMMDHCPWMLSLHPGRCPSIPGRCPSIHDGSRRRFSLGWAAPLGGESPVLVSHECPARSHPATAGLGNP